MPTRQIGKTSIPYTIRYSTRAKRQRIVVTSSVVEVVVPTNTTPAQVSAFLNDKQRWLLNAVTNRPEVPVETSQPYITGAKLLYRGHYLMLEITAADVAAVSIACHSSFHIQVPHSLSSSERQTAIAMALKAWMCDRALEAAFGDRCPLCCQTWCCAQIN